MSLNLECHLICECHSNWNVTQIGIPLKFECHSNWKTKYIEKVVNPKTSKSASIGRILILFINPWLGEPAGGTINSSAQLRVNIIV